jgi:FixJ family two-component response regulator
MYSEFKKLLQSLNGFLGEREEELPERVNQELKNRQIADPSE